MTTRELKQCRKAYRHFIADQLMNSNGKGARSGWAVRRRRLYFESFSVQIRRSVMGV